MAIKSKGTAGSTYHDQDMMALVDAGHGGNAVYFDILYGINNVNDNYKVYKIFFRDVDIAQGYEFQFRFLSSANTPNTSGAYGGGLHLGESLSTPRSIAWNNADHISLGLGRGAASAGGSYTANMELTIYMHQSQSGAKMNYHWDGMWRDSINSTQRVLGGGTTTTDGDYGIRVCTNDRTNARIGDYTYVMYGYSGWTR
tara:strand:+ start:714 stop:1310 length:597 start_codon:yes stop_codon:yes gene_type:complete